ncbi:unnamed protein product [Closterium sp. Naga37s-1]|nr:unnamed protein product [Closterium sp. Naga37s-1]
MSLAVIVVSLLLLRGASQPSVMAQMPDVMPRGQIGGEAGIERAMSLFRIWEEAYGLKPDVHLPPAKITLPAIVPRAPHLEDCEALTTARKESERRGGDGEPPLWARAVNNCSECNPQPPWVRGSDADNLPLTRVMQRDLWEHQLFHGSCDGRRLLVVPWPTKTHHGVGSQIHVMSTFLSLALIHNRTLVPAPGSYDRAFTETCNSTKTGGAWGCYFFPIVNPDCERVVSDMTASSTMPPLSSDKVGHNRLVASGDPVVHLNASCDSQMKLEARAAKLWGDAFARAPNVVEYMGEQPPAETNHPVVRACVRSLSHGSGCALVAIPVGALHNALVGGVAPTPRALVAIPVNALHAALALASHVPRHQQGAPHRLRPPHHTCMSAADAKAIKETYASLGGEPFVMRPIVSVHVRQSDKGTEMRLSPLATHMFFVHRLRRHVPDLRLCGSTPRWRCVEMCLSPLATHMFFVHRLRRHVPDLRHVWLNTEMEVRAWGNGCFERCVEMCLSPLATHMFFVHRLRRHVPDLRYVGLNTEMEVCGATNACLAHAFYSSTSLSLANGVACLP